MQPSRTTAPDRDRTTPASTRPAPKPDGRSGHVATRPVTRGIVTRIDAPGHHGRRGSGTGAASGTGEGSRTSDVHADGPRKATSRTLLDADLPDSGSDSS